MDPASGTPAIQIMLCDPKLKDSQTFRYNASSLQIVGLNNNCLDLDATDHRIELYVCNVPVSQNQKWIANTTGVVTQITTTDATPRCMASCEVINPGTVGDGLSATAGEHEVNISTSFGSSLRVMFYHDDVFRLWLAPTGTFTDPTHGGIIVKTDYSRPLITLEDHDTHWSIHTSAVELRVEKQPLLLSLHAKTEFGNKLIFKERQPLQWNSTDTWQSLASQPEEFFYGCGMQVGYVSHRGRSVLVEEGGGYDTGGRPNPAPFYLSTQGYGVFRNTYSPGQYTFKDNAVYKHAEFRFDAFYFYGPSLKQVLNLYTELTGRPFLPPVWGLHLGDSDCYNSAKTNRTTVDVLKVAVGYKDNDMPGGWFIPNDGYGCGYTSRPELVEVIESLHQLGFYTGLWTSTGLANATWEIGVAGSRAIKTDVGWVGDGYKFELDAVKLAANLLEQNSNSRRYIWTISGWAGTHHYAVIWTGDCYGTWSFIQEQIPAVTGAGLSGFAHASGDVDGIFGGSPDTYVRDLQWKCFLTVAMTMSGWSNVDKQPWRYGEPYTTYNRKYLKLKMRLTPYQYTLSREANTTGVPPTRAMVLEFPRDSRTWDNSTQYQFMSGEWLLVAPVYENATTRSNIYLPEAEWVDYNTGQHYFGPATLNDYPAPLDVLPVFVKAGAIIPLWPEMNSFMEKPHDPLTLDVYPPSINSLSTSFVLYEDDFLTQAFFGGAFATQRFALTANQTHHTISLGASIGSYDSKPEKRSYEVVLHVTDRPQGVMFDNVRMKEYATLDDLAAAASGYCYVDQGLASAVHVKTDKIYTESAYKVDVFY